MDSLLYDTSLRALVLGYYADGIIQFEFDKDKGWRLKLHDTNPDAPLSPFHISIRVPENKGKLTPERLAETGRLLWKKSQKLQLKFDGVAGLPNAGTPLAETFLQAAAEDGYTFPLVRLRKTVGPQGRQIDAIADNGGLSPGSVVLVIDDLITRGDTKDEGLAVLKNGGFFVRDVLVVFDRQQGGPEHLAKKHVNLCELMTMPEVLEILEEEGRITQTDRCTVLKYIMMASS